MKIGMAAVVPHSAMADSLMEEISQFVETAPEAEMLEEIREIRCRFILMRMPAR